MFERIAFAGLILHPIPECFKFLIEPLHTNNVHILALLDPLDPDRIQEYPEACAPDSTFYLRFQFKTLKHPQTPSFPVIGRIKLLQEFQIAIL